LRTLQFLGDKVQANSSDDRLLKPIK